MGSVETAMLNYITQRLEQGALGVTESEIMAVIIPPNHQEYRLRPAYRYGLDRLRVRRVINAASGIRENGKLHYFIGDYPSAELREFLSTDD